MGEATILIIEGVTTRRCDINALLVTQGWHVILSAANSHIQQVVRDRAPVLVIVESSQKSVNVGLKSVQQIRSVDKTVPIILIAGNSSEELAIEALRLGVSDYLKLPLTAETVVASIKHCLENTLAATSPICSAGALAKLSGGANLVGRSPSVEKIRSAISKIAITDCNVLITGGTGTGKELIVELLHKNSKRSHKGMVCINCAAIPDGLLESELFGYEKGAFTGAQISRAGKLEQANGGTIFLDEIGDLSAQSQAKILRAIETRQVQRLGGRESLPVNIRVVAATNQDLENMIAEGQFRQDLFFRLNVARLHLAPLRERKEDIPLLCEHFIHEFNSQFGIHVSGVSEQVLACLLRYTWPGNVRELRNVIEAAFINRPRYLIEVDDLPEAYCRFAAKAVYKESSQDNERDRVLTALLSTNWNKSKAAKKLHWSRMTLYRKMEKYHIDEDKVARSEPADIV